MCECLCTRVRTFARETYNDKTFIQGQLTRQNHDLVIEQDEEFIGKINPGCLLITEPITAWMLLQLSMDTAAKCIGMYTLGSANNVDLKLNSFV